MRATGEPTVELLHRFRFHPATTELRRLKHDQVRRLAGDLAVDLYNLLPAGRERDVAFERLEEVMFWANAALARQPA